MRSLLQNGKKVMPKQWNAEIQSLEIAATTSTSDGWPLTRGICLMLWGRAASMAFPFSMLNIAHLPAGFKNQTHVIVMWLWKLSDCCTLILLSGSSLYIHYQNTKPLHLDPNHLPKVGNQTYARKVPGIFRAEIWTRTDVAPAVISRFESGMLIRAASPLFRIPIATRHK